MAAVGSDSDSATTAGPTGPIRPAAPAVAGPAAPAKPAVPGWPRRAALRAAAGLGLALPLSTSACGASAAAKAGEAEHAALTAAARAGAATKTPVAGPVIVSPRPSAPPATAGAVQANGVTEVTRAGATTSAVALTFHGGGTPALANSLLGEAERGGAQVTVLAVGSWLTAYPQMAKRVLDGGHELGNHTQHHLNISALSPLGAYNEIAACAAELRKLTGSQGRWFRPSQAQHATATVRAAAAKAGYTDVLSYDVDPKDYADPGSAAIVRNVLGVIAPGDVVSLHLGHRGTVEALPAILAGLRTRGLLALTAADLFPAPDPARPARPVLPSQEAGQQ
ncbi:MAG TPA: polysaccharide deacetylase family protein [Actinocrinis sp.]|nr:polysaccharide deacetylase family protein [Actinocrinis sp.]